jgi:tetratricopeptide (TPR) repeat protein
MVKKDPKNVNAMLNLGIAVKGQARFADAKKIYNKVLELKPGMAEAEYALGILELRHLNNAEEARKHLKAFVRAKSVPGQHRVYALLEEADMLIKAAAEEKRMMALMEKQQKEEERRKKEEARLKKIEDKKKAEDAKNKPPAGDAAGAGAAGQPGAQPPAEGPAGDQPAADQPAPQPAPEPAAEPDPEPEPSGGPAEPDEPYEPGP